MSPFPGWLDEKVTSAGYCSCSSGNHAVRERTENDEKREGAVTTTMTASQLTATDRCDRCGAQAYVRATLASGSELLFCAHHAREYEPGLKALAASFQDESERLVDTPASATPDEH
jgi:hypothetical protein